MQSKKAILEQVHQYLAKFPDAREEVDPLAKFVKFNEGEELINRNNFTGHITTSAFIVDEKWELLLLLKHKSLNRWLQPGGHVDVTDASLEAAALREAVEETGIEEADLQLVSDRIFDIDSHDIPANSRKQEPAHIHHDVRFLFECSNKDALNISLEESTDSNWIPFTQLQDNEDFYWVEEKAKEFIAL